MTNTTDPKFGKNTIRILTTAMYKNPLFLYREYIQNAADQIDIVRSSGKKYTQNDESIFITINPTTKEIIIEDRATGIPSKDVKRILLNIAEANKDKNKHKGFFGIGRLGGLGYCEELIFETSYQGESIKSIVTWDALKSKQLTSDKNYKEDAVAIVKDTTSISTEKELVNEKYFKVILRGIFEKKLLDVDRVREYLSMVAPVPMQSKFHWKNTISAFYNDAGVNICEYPIFLNGDKLHKAYKIDILDRNSSSGIKDKIIGVQPIHIKDDDDSLLAIGWYGFTENLQSIPDVNYEWGIRLRKHNIQIGDETNLHSTDFYLETRFHKYYVGELHVLDERLELNARRDDFESNRFKDIFDEKLRDILSNTLSKATREVSKYRSNLNTIHEFKKTVVEFNEKQKNGFVTPKEQADFKKEILKKRQAAEKAQRDCDRHKKKIVGANNPITQALAEKIENAKKIDTSATKTLSEILKKNDEVKTPLVLDNQLRKFSEKSKKIVFAIFDEIRTELPPKVASPLIEKILQKLTDEEGFTD